MFVLQFNATHISRSPIVAYVVNSMIFFRLRTFRSYCADYATVDDFHRCILLMMQIDVYVKELAESIAMYMYCGHQANELHQKFIHLHKKIRFHLSLLDIVLLFLAHSVHTEVPYQAATSSDQVYYLISVHRLHKNVLYIRYIIGTTLVKVNNISQP